MSTFAEQSVIKTASGRLVPILAMEPHHVDLYDVAHALSHKCRWGGHCREFYSVAEHCCRVANLLEDWQADRADVIHGLFHDATEAYIPDFAQPTKWAAHYIIHEDGRPKIVSASDLEDRIYTQILSQVAPGLRPATEAVKRADRVLAVTEARDLMTVTPGTWPGWPPPDRNLIFPWKSPSEARDGFLKLAGRLLN